METCHLNVVYINAIIVVIKSIIVEGNMVYINRAG
jgi:hypothetical protein